MTTPVTPDEIARAANYLEAANNLLAQRFNYALVAHSMALTAYATCLGVPGKGQFVAIVVSSFGLIYSVIQYLITNPLTRKIDALRGAYLENDPVYAVYKTADGGWRPRGLQSVVVPLLLAIVWSLLLGRAIF